MDEGRGQVQAAPHATGVGANEPAGGIRKAEALQELVGPGRDPPARELGKAADQAQVLAAGEVRVDSGVLAREADAITDGVRFADHVVAEDLGAAAVSSARPISITVLPNLAFSSAGVPSAMTRPWSMTTMR